MTEIAPVIDPKKIVTDVLALKAIADRGLDPSYVEFWKDYAPTERDLFGVAKHYRDLKTGVCFAVIGQRPHFNEDGLRIEPRWYAVDRGYSAAPNRFTADVSGKQVTYACAKGKATWSPQVFLDGQEVSCRKATLLDADPINENYHQNTLEWDYGICKRRLRIIEGRLRERYFFFADPGGEVSIKSNWAGDINSGPDFAVDGEGRELALSSKDDVEIIGQSVFADVKEYPVVVASSPETYDNPGVDGYIKGYSPMGSGTFEQAHSGHTLYSNSAGDEAIADYYYNAGYKIHSIYRAGITWNTAALPNDATIVGATVSLYGSAQYTSGSPTINIYSFSPASNTSLENDDYFDFGTAAYCNTAIAAGSFSTSGYNAFALNSTPGLAAISKTGYTRIGVREVTIDVANDDPGASSDVLAGVRFWAEEKGSGYEPKIVITYTVPAAPTVTTQAASAVEVTTATGNGNITATGGSNATRRGFCYKSGTTGDPTTADSVAYDDGSYGTGAYTKGLTGLSAGTSYRVRAYAVNSLGTSYGVTVQILTKPAAPTNVAASENDGTKVVVTWTKSTGATAYQIYRVSTALGWLGDVATGEDTGGAAPVITPGAAVASDGDSLLHVTLSLSGESIANGTTYAYKVRAKNATGESADSATDNGYRDAQTVTHQWQRSSGDSDADYSNISGGTTDPYNDTGAPENGDGRYFKCVQDATGSVQATSSVDRGYRDAVTSSIEAIAGVAQADIEAIAAQTSIEAVAGVSNTS